MTKNKLDARVIKTRRLIEETFLRLLADTSFEKLTTTRLIKECMISKGTFYAHYLGKYDLAKTLMDRELDFFGKLLDQRFQDESQEVSDISQMVSQAMEESRYLNIFEHIQLPNRKPFILELQSVYQSAFRNYLLKKGCQGELELQSSLFGALVMTYISYIRQGHKSLSIEELRSEIDCFFENMAQSFPLNTIQ